MSAVTDGIDRPAWRVLLVDDEPPIRLLCRINLPRAEFELTEATDGETAVALAREQRFDLVLLDVMLPGMSGFAVAELLREERPQLAIVFLSARADEADVRRGRELGALDYVTKPFDPIRLGDHLTHLLRARNPGEAVP